MSDAEVLSVLKSIDLSLRTLVVIATRKAEERVKAAQSQAGPAIATDADLDGKYGDPELKFSPRDWTGLPCKGLKFSECPAELLDMVAETFDYFATQAEQKNELTTSGKPVAQYKRMDAARARGWAQRARAGKTTPAAEKHPSGWAGEGWS
jgi:hypothetical protein